VAVVSRSRSIVVWAGSSLIPWYQFEKALSRSVTAWAGSGIRVAISGTT
jgi:hypothetical protein